MNAPQNPNPILSPNTNPHQAQTPDPSSLTFDEVSRFFSIPLSDAADSLGVCPTVLKKICNENGLVRWPYRKFQAGKSIEEIKKDALIQKNKQHAEMPSIAGERGCELQNRTTASAQEISKSRNVLQPQVNKNFEAGSLQNARSSNLTRGTQASPDEFKYGFPSDGLSTVTYRWWGSSSPDPDEAMQVCNSESHQEKAQQSEHAANNGASDGKKSENNTEENNTNDPGASLLSAIRRRAVKEGETALKLGVYRGYGVNKLDWRKREVLLQIFKSSLPNQWEHGFS